jgi:Flp pilus assembly protein TadD/uncharacterized protein (AIM24 family)
MRGGDDTGDAPESRRLTPSIGLSGAPPDEEPLDQESNEDFLFHLYRGSELLQDDRAHEAKEELERALRLQPHDTKGQDLLAVVYFRLGHYPRALAIYEQLRRRNPKDTAILLNLALCYLKTGEAAQARRDLEQLVELNPAHTRAWGYLGLACERVGDLEGAERAFERGGHGQMVARMAGRRASAPAPAERPAVETALAEPVRAVVAEAFEELDAGELSFTLAEAESPEDDAAAQSWRPVELGHRRGASFDAAAPVRHTETMKPDTKDGPPPAPAPAHAPHAFAGPASVGRRPTLIAPAPPAANHADVERFLGPPSALGPNDSFPPPSVRRPVVAVPPVRPREAAGPAPDEAPKAPPTKFKTLPPDFDRRPGTEPPPPVAELTQSSATPFPETGNVVLHSSGLALVTTGRASTFAARVESIRVSSSTLAILALERRSKGKATGESFGGPGAPIVHATGEGQLVLGPRPGKKLVSFALQDEGCFVREAALLGFDGELAFDNGRLSTGDGESVAIVHFRGKGAVLLETTGETLSLEVRQGRGLNVRGEVVLAWFGRIIPRALASADSPTGQHGLVAFAGEGRVLVSAV